MEIKEKVALITGGGSGLGAASARMLVEGGGRVVLVDVDQERAEALAQELGSAAQPAGGDVGRPEQMAAAVALALERFGRLDIALNCAGIGGSQRVVSKEGPVALEWFTKIIQVNLIGTFNVIRLSAAAMTRNAPDGEGERGVIINTASTAAYEGQIGQAAYSASKGGIVGMTLPIARELGSTASGRSPSPLDRSTRPCWAASRKRPEKRWKSRCRSHHAWAGRRSLRGWCGRSSRTRISTAK